MIINEGKRKRNLNESPVFTPNLIKPEKLQEVINEYIDDCNKNRGEGYGYFRNSNLSNTDCDIDQIDIVYNDRNLFVYYEAIYWASDFEAYEIASIFNEFSRSFKECCKKNGVYCPKIYYLSLPVDDGECKVFELPMDSIQVKPEDSADEADFYNTYCLTAFDGMTHLPEFVTSMREIQFLKNSEIVPYVEVVREILFKLVTIPNEHRFAFAFCDDNEDLVISYTQARWDHATFIQMKNDFLEQLTNYYRHDYEIDHIEFEDLDVNSRHRPWAGDFIPDDNLTIDTLPEEAFQGENTDEWDEDDWRTCSGDPDDSYFDWWTIGDVSVFVTEEY